MHFAAVRLESFLGPGVDQDFFPFREHCASARCFSNVVDGRQIFSVSRKTISLFQGAFIQREVAKYLLLILRRMLYQYSSKQGIYA